MGRHRTVVLEDRRVAGLAERERRGEAVAQGWLDPADPGIRQPGQFLQRRVRDRRTGLRRHRVGLDQDAPLAGCHRRPPHRRIVPVGIRPRGVAGHRRVRSAAARWAHAPVDPDLPGARWCARNQPRDRHQSAGRARCLRRSIPTGEWMLGVFDGSLFESSLRHLDRPPRLVARGGDDPIVGFRLSPDGTRIYTRRKSSALRVVSRATGVLLSARDDAARVDQSILGATIGPDERWMAVALGNEQVHVHDLECAAGRGATRSYGRQPAARRGDGAGRFVDGRPGQPHAVVVAAVVAPPASPAARREARAGSGHRSRRPLDRLWRQQMAPP